MKITTLEIAGLESAIKGMRLPMMSRDKMDSHYLDCADYTGNSCKKCPYKGDLDCENNYEFYIGENDMGLCKRLVKAGSEHHKFTRMIQVWADVDMPRYWWSEADTYKFGVKNSESTMHRLLNNPEPISLDQFVITEEDMEFWESVIGKLEFLRLEFRNSTDAAYKNRLLVRAKRILPEGFLQMRTWNTNYAELRNMYYQRKNHRLKEEWKDVFCAWIESLPYAKELIIGE